MNAYPNASIYAHLAMSAAQAIELAREHGMLLVHLKTGNYQLIPALLPILSPASSLLCGRGGSGWKLME